VSWDVNSKDNIKRLNILKIHWYTNKYLRIIVVCFINFYNLEYLLNKTITIIEPERIMSYNLLSKFLRFSFILTIS
jgi:hypothetical protein